MQSSSEQPLVGEERYVTTRITAAKETSGIQDLGHSFSQYGLANNLCVFRLSLKQSYSNNKKTKDGRTSFFTIVKPAERVLTYECFEVHEKVIVT